MSEPEFGSLTESELNAVNDSELAVTYDKLDAARTKAAYWKGRCEGLELNLDYLKNRINQLEAKDRGE